MKKIFIFVETKNKINMKLWYIKALRAEKERQQQVTNISIGQMQSWWTRGRGSFNSDLYKRISQIKAS